MNYYNETGKILADHPIFIEYRIRKKIKGLNGLSLSKRKNSLENSIWRDRKKLSSQNVSSDELEKIKLRLKSKEIELKLINEALASI